LKGGPETQEILAGLRATYEPLLDGLASALLLKLPPWIASEDATDHWQRGHRGLIASRLIEQLSDRSDVAASPDPSHVRPAQRLRSRLRLD
jgi:hypothetical protein